jgi:hypothetical protein
MSTRSRAHDAPGLLAATELQFVRALGWLARAPSEARIGLETGDDVVVESSTVRISEQDKSSLQDTGHPFTDRSKALWKTLAIWADDAREDRPFSDRLYLLVTNRPVPDCLARRLSFARDVQSSETSAAEIRRYASELPPSLRTFAQPILTLDDPSLAQLIRSIQLCDGSDLALTDHAGEIASLLHFPPKFGDPSILIDALSGWLRRHCRDCWSAGQPAWIERASFDHQYHAIVENLRLDRSRERAANLIPIDPASKEEARSKLFAQQLLLIAAEDEDVDNALICYLRFGRERFRLTEIGDISELDWNTFFSQLEERWQRLVRACTSERGTSDDEELGRVIFRRTADDGFRGDLAGQRTTAEYFTSGGYHRLADDSLVWWHPKFFERFKP